MVGMPWSETDPPIGATIDTGYPAVTGSSTSASRVTD